MASPRRVGTREDAVVPCDAIAGTRGVRQHEQASHVRRPPPESLSGDTGREPGLDIVPTKCLLDRVQRSLHLDDEQGSRWSVPSEHVDRASLGVHGEAHLRLDLPTEPRQPERHVTNQGSVPLVEQPVDFPAAPSQGDDQFGVEGLRDRSKASKRHRIEPAALRARHRVLGEVGALGDVRLPPAEAMAECSKPAPSSDVIHSAIFANRALLERTWRLSPDYPALAGHATHRMRRIERPPGPSSVEELRGTRRVRQAVPQARFAVI